jgi:hypothetical protein
MKPLNIMNRRTRQELHAQLIFGLLIGSLGLGPVFPAAAQAGAAGIAGVWEVTVEGKHFFDGSLDHAVCLRMP